MQHKNALPLWLWVLMVLQAPEQSPSHLALLFSAVSLLDVIALPGRFSLPKCGCRRLFSRSDMTSLVCTLSQLCALSLLARPERGGQDA